MGICLEKSFLDSHLLTNVFETFFPTLFVSKELTGKKTLFELQLFNHY